MIWIIGFIVLNLMLAGMAAALSQMLLPPGQPWPTLILEWMAAARKVLTTVWGWFGDLKRYVFDSEHDKLIKDLRAIWTAEDQAYKEALEKLYVHQTAERTALNAARAAQLEAREKQTFMKTGRTWGSLVAFIIGLIAMPPVFVASFYLKKQVAQEFLVGSANLKGLTIPLGEYSIKIGMVEIASGGLIALEILAGVLLSHSMERLSQIEKGEIHESTGPYTALKWFAIVFMFVLVVLEGFLGIFRGEIEVGGQTFGTVWLVTFSILVPLMTMAVAYMVKSTLRHVTGPVGKLIRGLIALALFIPTVVIFLIILVVVVLAHLVLMMAYYMAMFMPKPDISSSPPQVTEAAPPVLVQEHEEDEVTPTAVVSPPTDGSGSKGGV